MAFQDDVWVAVRKLAISVERTGEMLRAVDYLLSGDYGEESFLEEWHSLTKHD